MFLSHPSTYITASDPEVFGDQEVVIRDQSTGTDYTPEDWPQLFEDAGLDWAIPIGEAYIGGVPFADEAHFPNVDVYAEKGSGLETLVGFGLTDSPSARSSPTRPSSSPATATSTRKT